MTADVTALAPRIRTSIIEESYRAGVGHIGSALSIADILAVLFGQVLNIDDEEDRDRLILSKGHAALALYAALAATGRLSSEELASYCSEGTALGAHPEHVVPGIDFSTGSLGHGLSIGAGAALGARLQGSMRRSFVLISDAELNEGSVWEAVMFAAQQALGYTRDVLDLEPVADRWRQFGWLVDEVDGHDLDQLTRSIDVDADPHARPRLVIARTTFGKGVSYMQGKIEWHYLPMSDEHFAQAMEELEMASAAEGLS
jgi:transketolase